LEFGNVFFFAHGGKPENPVESLTPSPGIEAGPQCMVVRGARSQLRHPCFFFIIIIIIIIIIINRKKASIYCTPRICK
jgi:hypothetical protein